MTYKQQVAKLTKELNALRSQAAQAESAGGATSTGIFDGIELPPVVKKAVPEKGTVEVGGYDGSEAKSALEERGEAVRVAQEEKVGVCCWCFVKRATWERTR